MTLATPRTLGYVFNPLSVYWCYRADGTMAARVAEVHNTHGQRHTYLLPPDGTARLSKELEVSPYHPRHGSYRMRISDPDDGWSWRSACTPSRAQPSPPPWRANGCRPRGSTF